MLQELKSFGSTAKIPPSFGGRDSAMMLIHIRSSHRFTKRLEGRARGYLKATMSLEELKGRRRDDYRFLQEYRTRWYVKLPGAAMSTRSRMIGLTTTCMVGRTLVPTVLRVLTAPIDHMNNSVYSFLYLLTQYSFRCKLIQDRFDSIINAYLIENCGLRPSTSSQIGLVVNSHCDYFGSVGFPMVVDLGLRVNKLGKSSVAYEVGVFERGKDDVRVVGGYTHVFVERERNRPAPNGMAEDIRRGLKKLLDDGKPKL